MALSNPPVEIALVLVARLALGGIFLVSAIGKLRDLRGFAQGVADYRLLPTGVARGVALALPVIELALALALLLGVALPLAGGAAMLLLLTFSAALVVNLRRGRLIACACHGIAGTRTISWGTVARNLALLLLAVPLVFTSDVFRTAVVLARWRAEIRIITSPDGIAVALLLACCFVIAVLIEWAVDSAAHASRLRTA